MARIVSRIAFAVLPLLAGMVFTGAAPPAAQAEDNGVGLTPAMGWSSWSFVRQDPTAATIEAQADALKSSGLDAVGYKYVNVDDFWYQCPGSQGPNVDAYGRWVTDPVKFPPSASGENGIQVVADHVHALGLGFGLYVTPGISAQAVAQNTAIEGTPYHADDIALPASAEKNYNCKGMVGIDYTKPGAQAFVDSWAKQFASWGVDYVKIDGVGTPDIPDVQSWSAALQSTGRPIHLELSNNLDVTNAAVWGQYSNGWRTGGDVECYCGPGGASYPLTDWNHIESRFNQAATWQPYGKPGAFNDYDSIEVGNGDNDGLTPDERKTELSLWSLAASPLILGTDLTKLDPADLKLLRNTEVVAVDQDAIDASRVASGSGYQVFSKTEANGDVVVGLFNTTTTGQVVSVPAASLALPTASSYDLRDLWTHHTSVIAGSAITAEVPAHGVQLYRITPDKGTHYLDPQTTVQVTGPATLTTGGSASVTATFTNLGTAKVTDLDLRLSVPAGSGWRVTPTSVTCFASVAPGQQIQATYSVSAPASTSVLFRTDSLAATALYGATANGMFPSWSSSDGAADVVLTSPVQAPNQTFASTTAFESQLGSKLGILAEGSNVYGSTNQYGAIYQPGAVHDGSTTTVELTAQAYTSSTAEAGIMVRNDITASGTSPGYVTVGMSVKKGYFLQWDSNGDGKLDTSIGTPNATTVGKSTYPSWLKLVRSGTSFTGYYSTDDVNWKTLGTVSVPSAAASQDVGLFAMAKENVMAGEADFDQFTVS